jgi:hypothetical protein
VLPHLLSKIRKITINKSITIPVALFEFGTYRREEPRLEAFKNSAQKNNIIHEMGK